MKAIHHTSFHAIFCGRCRGAGRMFTAIPLVVLGLVLSAGSVRAGALTFVVTPPHAMLDGDPIPDIEVQPGDRVEYFVSLSTISLANARGGPFPGVPLIPLVNFSYKVIYDPVELDLDRSLVTGFKLDLLDDPATMPGGLFPGGDALLENVKGTLEITHVGGNLAAGSVRPLDFFPFKVLAPNDDGIADFKFADVLINGVAPAARDFTSDLEDEVQPPPQRVPEPATLLLFGGAIIGLLLVARLRRRRQQGSRAYRTRQDLGLAIIAMTAGIIGQASAGMITSLDSVSGPGLGTATDGSTTLNPNNDNAGAGVVGNRLSLIKTFNALAPIDMVFNVQNTGGTTEYSVGDSVRNMTG